MVIILNLHTLIRFIWTRDNLKYCKEYGIRITDPRLGRPYKQTEENKILLRELRKQERIDEGIRSTVEGKFE
ncbi:hypothetical protein MASR2M48_16280 [Spirochaetota bacterium]